MKKKHVILSTSNDTLSDQRMQRIAQTLVAAGYELSWLGRYSGNDALPDLPIRFNRFKCWFNKGPLFYIELNLRLFFCYLSYRADVIHAVDADTLLAAVAAKLLTGTRVVFDAHEWFTEVPELAGRNFVKKIWLLVERWGVKQMDAGITVSSGIAEHYRLQYGVTFSVIRNMPVLSEHNTIKEVHKSQLIYQGALNAGRGIENLLHAVKKLNMKLVLAGTGDIEEKLRAMCTNLELTNAVVFCGRLSPAELKHATQESFIGLNLLDGSSKSYYYSLANKFFDYVHAGVPQLSMQFPEYVAMNAEFEVAVLIKDFSTEEIMKGITRLVEDDDLWQRLHHNCRQAAGKWNWQSEEKKVLALYENVFALKE